MEKLDLKNLRNSLNALERMVVYAEESKPKEGSVDYESARSAVIKAFETAYELCWKYMFKWVEKNIEDVELKITKRELFVLARESGLIDDVDTWFSYHSARNKSLHLYEEETAEEVFALRHKFLADAKNFLSVLEQKND